MKSLKQKKAIFSASKLILISATEMAKSAKKDCFLLREIRKFKQLEIFHREIMSSRKIASYSVDLQKVKNLKKSKMTLNKLRNSFKDILQWCLWEFHLFLQLLIKPKHQTLRKTKNLNRTRMTTNRLLLVKEVSLSKNWTMCFSLLCVIKLCLSHQEVTWWWRLNQIKLQRHLGLQELKIITIGKRRVILNSKNQVNKMGTRGVINHGNPYKWSQNWTWMQLLRKKVMKGFL